MFTGMFIGWALWMFLFFIGVVVCTLDEQRTTEIKPAACLFWIILAMLLGACVGELFSLTLDLKGIKPWSTT